MTHLLLFSARQKYLGEFFFEEGVLERSVLSPAGEAEVGELLSHWRVMGIPVSGRIDRATEDGKTTADHTKTHVAVRSTGALSAVQTWAEQLGCQTIDLPPRLVSLWESLAELDLHDEERFGSLLAIRHASHRHMLAWQHALQEVRRATSRASSLLSPALQSS